MTGRTAHLSGLAAEAQVADYLERRGLEVIARRWRGAAGEIDLICAEGGTTVFVEVKRAASQQSAAHSLLPRQIARIRAAASEYAGTLPAGQDSDMRFDVALVHGVGEIEIIRNALIP